MRRRLLSLLLVVVTVFGLLTTSASASGMLGGNWGGGGILRVAATIHPGTKGKGAVKQAEGFYSGTMQANRGSYGIRMKAVPLDGSTVNDGDYGYFWAESRGGKTYINQYGPEQLVNAPGYNTTDGWLYFCDGGEVNPKGSQGDQREGWTWLQVFDDGVASNTVIWKTKSAKYNTLLDICGMPYTRGLLTNAEYLESVLTNPKMKDDDRKVCLGEFLGLSNQQAQNYYIVVEQVRYAQQYYYGKRTQEVDKSTGEGHVGMTLDIAGCHFMDWDWMVCESLATYKAKDPGYPSGIAALLFGTEAAFNGFKFVGGGCKTGAKFVSLYIDTIQWWQKADKAPFPDTEMGERFNGYSLYSFGDLATAKAGGNIAVEYQGDVGTSIPTEFTSAGSLMNGDTPTSYSYYDFTGERWVETDDTTTLLQFFDIDCSDEYSIIMSSADEYKVGGNIPINKDYTNAFSSDLITGGYTLGWGQDPVTSYPVNVGQKWLVKTIDGVPNISPIKTRFENAFNAVAVTQEVAPEEPVITGISHVAGVDTINEFREMPVLGGSWSNANRGMSFSDNDVLSVADNKTKLNNEKALGIGYEFIIRGTPVTSKKITFTVTVNAESEEIEDVGYSQTWMEDYNTAKEASCDLSDGILAWMVVPGDGDADGTTGAIDSNMWAITVPYEPSFSNAMMSASSKVRRNGASRTTIGLGSEDDDGSELTPPVGYTIYEVIVKYEIGGQTAAPQPRGEVTLPAYMLNRYFDNIIQESSRLRYGSPLKYTLRPEWTWTSWCDWVTLCCGFGGYTNYKDDWVIEYYDSASSSEFGYDNAMIDRYYPYATGTWSHARRSELTHAWQVSENTKGISPLVVDYGFNLIRARVKDYRALSGISYETYVAATGDGSDLLKLKSYFGVVPHDPIVPADAMRDSHAVAENGTFTEKFSIESRFGYYSSKEGWQCPTSPPHYHAPCYHSHGSGDNTWSHNCSGLSYYIDSDRYEYTALGFQGPYGPVNTISYSFENTVFKYMTDIMRAGWNTAISGDNGSNSSLKHVPMPTNLASKAQEHEVTSRTAYRFASARYVDGATLKYYPEFYMVFKIGGTDMATINGQEYSHSYVIGEVERKAKVSGLYFLKVNTTADGATVTDFPGTVYSDSMQGGSGILSMGNIVSIPAGADVTVAADPNNIRLDLYGYALDIVQTSDNGKLGAIGSGKQFKEVVADGEDVYGKWSNDSRATIDQYFEDWCKNLLDVKNFAADFKLYVDGGLKSENFSATIGQIDRSSVTTKQEGVYQIVIEKGVLQTGKGDYQAMLKQLAKDYFSDESQTGKAAQLFEASGLYQTIIKAMETCKNDINNSQDTSEVNGTWTNQLGGNGHWYDETSRTFVIRRYENVGNMIRDVIASDKIDYQLAPTGGTQSSENINSALSYNAKWELNIFFDQNAADKVNDLLTDWSGSGNYYKPQNGNVSNTQLQNANSKFTVLVDGMYISGADFKIPSSSTQDFYN